MAYTGLKLHKEHSIQTIQSGFISSMNSQIYREQGLGIPGLGMELNGVIDIFLWGITSKVFQKICLIFIFSPMDHIFTLRIFGIQMSFIIG